jgi:hypothetical protein
MITEDYVSFETAKLLKEKGFDRYPLFPCYQEDNGKFIDTPTTLDTINYCFIPASTLQMAMKWLREVHDIQVEICIVGAEPWENPTKWLYGWRVQNTVVIDRHKADYKLYEEACEAAIKYCLENLI